MNKKLWIITAATVALLGTSTVIAAQSPGIVSKAKAKETALKAVNGVVEDIDLERERGKLVYEIEVQTSGSSEDTTVIIDAKTGELIAIYEDDADEKAAKSQKTSNASGGAGQAVSQSVAAANTSTGKDKASGAIAATGSGQASGSATVAGGQASGNSSSSNGTVKAAESSTATRTLLTQEQVKKIVLDTVQGTIIEIDLDKDARVVKYEVDVRTAQGKVELDIDAYSGKVLSQKLDDDDDRYDDDDDRYDDDYDDQYDNDRYDDDYDHDDDYDDRD